MNRSEILFDAVLERLRPDLAPGAEDVIRSRNGKNITTDTVPQLIEFLATNPQAARFLKPGRTFVGKDEPMLNAILRRLPIGESSVRGLASDWHYEFSALPPAKMAEQAIAKLERRENWHHFEATATPPLPAAEEKIAHALRWFGPDIDASKIAEFARVNSRLGHGSPTTVLQGIAKMLTHAHIAETITRTGKPIETPGIELSIAARTFDAEFAEQASPEQKKVNAANRDHILIASYGI